MESLPRWWGQQAKFQVLRKHTHSQTVKRKRRETKHTDKYTKNVKTHHRIKQKTGKLQIGKTGCSLQYHTFIAGLDGNHRTP